MADDELTAGEGLTILLTDHASVDWIELRPEAYDPKHEVEADTVAGVFRMGPMHGEGPLCIVIRRGVSPQFAAKLLRDTADVIDRHGAQLLNLPHAGQGFIDPGGTVVMGQWFRPDFRQDVS
jgi:hypothetical protein